MNRKTRARGAAFLELIISMVFLIVCVQVMVVFFTTNAARNRNFLALPRISREAAFKHRAPLTFTPSEQTTCKLPPENFSSKTGQSLYREEWDYYVWATQKFPETHPYKRPLLELRRVDFKARSVHKGMPIKGVNTQITMDTSYAQVHLLPR